MLRPTRRDVVEAALLPLLALPLSATAAPRGGLGARQRRAVEDILRRQIAGGTVPGIGYSIGNARETLAEGGFGLRSVAAGLPVRGATRFALASVSKQFAAACVFLLQQQRALSIDAPLADYVPEYRDARLMTLRQVLTMTSGIPADTLSCEAPLAGRMDTATLIENLNRKALDFAPGRRFAYSN